MQNQSVCWSLRFDAALFTACVFILCAGKVLAPFKSRASIPLLEAKALMKKHFGEAAANKFESNALLQKLEKVTASFIATEWKLSGSLSETKNEGLNVVLAGAQKDWGGLAVAGMGLFAEIPDDKYATLGGKLAGAVIDMAGRMKHPVVAAAGFAVDAACETLKVEPVQGVGCREEVKEEKYCLPCTASDCLSVFGDVATGFTVGAKLGPYVAVAGATVGLAKSLFSGDLEKCAKGVAHNLMKGAKAATKFLKTAAKFIPTNIPEAKRFIGKVVSGANQALGTLVKGTKQVLGIGMKVVNGIVTEAKTLVNNVVKTTRRVITNVKQHAYKAVHSAVKGGMVVIDSGVRAATNFGRTITNKVYQVIEPVGRVMKYAYNSAGRVVPRLYDYGVEKAGQAFDYTVKKVGQGIDYTVKKVGQAVDYGVKKAGQAVDYVVKKVDQAVGYVKKKVYQVLSWLTGRRRRSMRRATNASDVTPDSNAPVADKQAEEVAASEAEQVLQDAMLVASATLNLRSAAVALYFNVTDGLPLDIGALAYPDIEAKYRTNSTSTTQDVEAEAFASSFATVQHLTSKKVDLDAQIETAAYMMNTAGRCLQDGTCDLQDNVDRYKLALELMTTRRNDIVFGIVEDLADMGQSFTQPESQDLSLPDAPTLGDLKEQLGKFDDAHVAAQNAVGDSGLVAKEALVYYNISAETNPGIFMDLHRTGIAYVNVPPPPATTTYRDVRMIGQDVRVYVFPTIMGLPGIPTVTQHGTTTFLISKGSWSAHVPTASNAEPTVFLHTDQTRVYTFAYNSKTCADVTFPCVPSSCESSGGYFQNRASPYGEWRIQIQGDSQEWRRFKGASHIRLAFKVRWYEDSSKEASSTNDVMFGNDACHGATTCILEADAPPVVPDECTRMILPKDEVAVRGTNTSEQVNISTVRPTMTDIGEASVEDTSNNAGVIIGIVVAMLLCCVFFAVAVVFKLNRDEWQKSSENAHVSNEHYVMNETRFDEAFDDSLEKMSQHNGNGDEYLGIDGVDDKTGGSHFVGAMARVQAEQLLRDAGLLLGDFLVRESKGKHALTLVKTCAEGKRTIIHHSIAAVSPGEYSLNGSTTVAAGSMPELVQQWLNTPAGTTVLLGANIVMHPHWDARGERILANPAYTSSDGAQPEYAEIPAVPTNHGVIPNPSYALGTDATAKMQAKYATAENTSVAAEYSEATNALANAVDSGADYDTATNVLGNEPEYDQATNEQFAGLILSTSCYMPSVPSLSLSTPSLCVCLSAHVCRHVSVFLLSFCLLVTLPPSPIRAFVSAQSQLAQLLVSTHTPNLLPQM